MEVKSYQKGYFTYKESMDHSSMKGMNHSNMKGMDMNGMDHSSMTTNNSTMHNMSAMKMSFNLDMEGFIIIFDWWLIDSATKFYVALAILFVVSFLSETLGLLAIRLSNRFIKTILTTIRSLFGALLMLAMMNFNGYVILAIVLGSSLSHLLIPANQLKDSYICH